METDVPNRILKWGGGSFKLPNQRMDNTRVRNPGGSVALATDASVQTALNASRISTAQSPCGKIARERGQLGTASVGCMCVRMCALSLWKTRCTSKEKVKKRRLSLWTKVLRMCKRIRNHCICLPVSCHSLRERSILQRLTDSFFFVLASFCSTFLQW